MYALTHAWVDWLFIISMVVGLVVYLVVQFHMDKDNHSMRRTLEDYEYSRRMAQHGRTTN